MTTPIDTTPIKRSFLEILLQGGLLSPFTIVLFVSTALVIAFAVRVLRRRIRHHHYAPSIGDGMLFGGTIALIGFALGGTVAGAVAALSVKGIDAEWAIIFAVEEATTCAIIGMIQVITMLSVAFLASATSRKPKPETPPGRSGHPFPSSHP